VVLGDDCVLHAGVTVYPRVRVGRGFTAFARAVVREDVRIGDRVTIHAGAVIGSDGFGYLPAPDGIRKIPQVGTVVIEDDVEIGANATIDRAALGATTIGRGTKIDNLVMVAHGVVIGPHGLLAAQAGVSGSTRIGSHVTMAGQSGSAGHLRMGDRVVIAAKTAVFADVPDGAFVAGIPAVDHRAWKRSVALVKTLPELRSKLRALEQRLAALENHEKGNA
jgi:UDP-3-O-[3-hydroxymyristoyl] glucosamine N-acyltransferase